MNRLKIENPASGAVIAEVAADDMASVTAKAMDARVAQRAWAAATLADRKACLASFRGYSF